jgi:hypothetical protein
MERSLLRLCFVSIVINSGIINAQFLSRTIELLLLGHKENRPFGALDLHYGLSYKVLFLFQFLM